MAFISWVDEYTKAKNALADRTWSAYFQSSIENRDQMRTTYTKLNNVTAFIDWLKQMADEEILAASDDIDPGAIPFCIGGG
jgi:hypothetical protein